MTDAERIVELEKQVAEMQETIDRLSDAERFMAICRDATMAHLGAANDGLNAAGDGKPA